MARWLFVYGSLLNAATHEGGQVTPARLAGWRRCWRRSVIRPYAFLSIAPAPGQDLRGGLIRLASGADAAFDQREAAYERLDVSAAIRCDVPSDGQVITYRMPAGRHEAPSDAHPILLSYVETVLQGAAQLWGAGGMAELVASSDGWAGPILDDRAAPLYPRAQPLPPHERGRAEALLRGAGARIIRP